MGGVIEIALGVYCGWATWLICHYGQYGILPFLALYTSGFLTVGILTVLHTTGFTRRRLEAAESGRA